MESSGVPESVEVENERLRWPRAASWARGQSLGPWGRLLEDEATEAARDAWRAECRRVEALAGLILAVGEERAAKEYGRCRCRIDSDNAGGPSAVPWVDPPCAGCGREPADWCVYVNAWLCGECWQEAFWQGLIP